LLSSLPPLPPLFPYTTLFRSRLAHPARRRPRLVARGRLEAPVFEVTRDDRDHAASAPPAPLGAIDATRACNVPRPCHSSRSSRKDRKSTRLNSSHDQISYAVF